MRATQEAIVKVKGMTCLHLSLINMFAKCANNVKNVQHVLYIFFVIKGWQNSKAEETFIDRFNELNLSSACNSEEIFENGLLLMEL